jgi:hypothetical protein
MRDLDLSCARWKKSTYSNAGGNCVEVAAVWRKTGYSNNAGECVEVTHASVRLTNAGSGDGGNRSAATRARPAVAVRDSEDPDGPVLSFGRAEWHAFAASVK